MIELKYQVRIGNLVHGHDPRIMKMGIMNEPEKGLFEVTSVDEDGINLWRVEGFSDEYASDVKGLPITGHILELCGFKCISADSIYRLGPFDYIPSNKNYHWWIFGQAWGLGDRLIYVHQLQNLYQDITGQRLIYKS